MTSIRHIPVLTSRSGLSVNWTSATAEDIYVRHDLVYGWLLLAWELEAVGGVECRSSTLGTARIGLWSLGAFVFGPLAGYERSLQTPSLTPAFIQGHFLVRVHLLGGAAVTRCVETKPIFRAERTSRCLVGSPSADQPWFTAFTRRTSLCPVEGLGLGIRVDLACSAYGLSGHTSRLRG